MTIEKPIPFGSEYIMKPGMTYRDICIGMRLDESEIEAGILALEMLNGPEEQFIMKHNNNNKLNSEEKHG